MTAPEDAPTPPPVPSATIAWLRERLASGSHRIAPLISEWCGGHLVRQANGTPQWEGGRDGTNGQFIADLMAARHMLGVVAVLDDNGCYCWRLPDTRRH